MKRINAALAALFVLSIISGCTQGDAMVANDTAVNSPAAIIESTAQYAYNAYQEIKADAFERVISKIDPNMEMYFDKIMAAGLGGYYLSPLSAMENKPADVKFVESFGITDFKSVKTDRGYDITYVDPQGIVVKQGCVYDASKDYMQTVVTDTEGTEVFFFEYMRSGSGYKAQYTADGLFVKAFIEEAGVAAFGVQIDEGIREPLSGEAERGIDYVKNDDFYFILEGDKLNIVENGEPLVF